MFFHLSVILFTEGGLCLGVSVQVGLCLRGLCSGERSLSRGWVSVNRRGLCQQEGSLSRRASVQGGSLSERSLSRGSLFKGVSVQEVSVQGGSLSRRASVQGGLCLGGLCPMRSLSSGGLCPGGSLSQGLCPGGSLSRWVYVQSGVSVRETPIWLRASYWYDDVSDAKDQTAERTEILLSGKSCIRH